MRLFAAGVMASLFVAACSAAPGDGSEPIPASGPAATGTSAPSGTNDAPTTPHDPAADADGGAHAEPDAGGADAAAHKDSGPDAASPPNSCPALTFPSGVKIQTFKDAATTETYAKHLTSGEIAPPCFLDTTNLVNPDTGEKYDMTVQVATHFQMEELVGTEVAEGYGHHVLLSPSAVHNLEAFREALGVAMTINSGFRSPLHQEAVCKSLCGDPLGCPGTCANNSRHMWGDAFDLPLEFYNAHDEDEACASGFKFAYLESGTHLHIDENPAYATCVKE